MRSLVLFVFLVIQWGSASAEIRRSIQKRSDDNALQVIVENLAQKVNVLEAKLNKAQTSVAFHVHFTRDFISLGPHAPLIFDSVRTNTENGYDKTTGVFRAPVSGTYMFVVNYMGDRNTHMYIYVYVDQSVEDYSISHGDGLTWDHVSESLVIHLNAGQTVHLGHGENATKTIRGLNWTTFSGFLVQADP